MMEIGDRKPPWSPPSLVVLVRGKPEESVLMVCKLLGVLFGPSQDFGQCEGPKHVGSCLKCKQGGRS